MTAPTNGTAPRTAHQAGRAAHWPTVNLSSGFTLEIRRLASDIMLQVTVKANMEHAGAKPAIPTQPMETAPGVTTEVENEADPEYRKALQEWQNKINEDVGRKIQQILSYAVVTATDEQLVAEHRAAMDLLGIELPDDDRAVFLWHIAAPTPSDQKKLATVVFNGSIPSEEEIAATRESFRG